MPQIDGGSYWDLPSGKKRARVKRKNHRAPTPKTQWQATFTHMEALRRWVGEVNRDLDNGLDPERSRIEEAQTLTVGEWWDRWWPVRCDAGISLRYKGEMERRWRLHVQPQWGDVTLAGITSEDVQAWVNRLALKYGAVYVEDIYKTFNTLLGAAVDRRPKLLDLHPCYKIRLPAKSTRSRVTTDEHGMLAIARRCGDFEIMVVTLWATGLRWEECAGLMRGGAFDRHPHLPPGPRVDTLNRVLRIPYEDGALIDAPGGTIEQGPLKNRHSERIIAIPRFLADLLAQQLASHKKPYVFVGPRGGVVRRNTFEPRFWRPACDGRPASHVRNHQPKAAWAPVCPGLEAGRGLRHTHKKMLQDAGIPDFAIEARLGHSKKGISGVYSHVSAQMEARIVKAIETRWELALEAETAAAAPVLVSATATESAS